MEEVAPEYDVVVLGTGTFPFLRSVSAGWSRFYRSYWMCAVWVCFLCLGYSNNLLILDSNWFIVCSVWKERRCFILIATITTAGKFIFLAVLVKDTSNLFNVCSEAASINLEYVCHSSQIPIPTHYKLRFKTHRLVTSSSRNMETTQKAPSLGQSTAVRTNGTPISSLNFSCLTEN